MNLSRRDLLKTLALGAGVAPVLSPLGRNFLPNAHAAETGAPRRIIFFGNPNGLPGGRDWPENWVFRPGATYAQGVFGDTLKPVEHLRDQIVMIQGTEMKKHDSFGVTSDHNNAATWVLTGSMERPGSGLGRNASIDQHLRRQLGTKLTPKFPIVMTGIQCPSETHSRSETGAWVQEQNNNPYDLYNKLFMGLVTGDGPAMPDPKVLARIDNRQSVLDYAAKDLVDFQKRLSSEQRERADIQLQAIRTLEGRLVKPTAGTPQKACGKPTIPQGLVWQFPRSENVPQLAIAMNDMVVAALACDLTRIVHMQNWGSDYSLATCNFAPVNTRQGWHSLSHLDPNVDAYKRAKTWLHGVVADLANKLKTIPEAGGSMLDNTLIFVYQDHGQDHNEWNQQFYTIGGKNLGVKVGQNFVLGQDREGSGLEHNRVLVSMLNVMGMPEEKWGTDPGRGPLSGFAS